MAMKTFTRDECTLTRCVAHLDIIAAKLKMETAKAKSDSLRQIEALDDELAAQYALAGGANHEVATPRQIQVQRLKAELVAYAAGLGIRKNGPRWVKYT